MAYFLNHKIFEPPALNVSDKLIRKIDIVFPFKKRLSNAGRRANLDQWVKSII